MIVVLRPDATQEQVAWVQSKLQARGLETRYIHGAERSVLAVIGTDLPDPREVGLFPGVSKVMRVSRPYKLASREAVPETSQINVGGVIIGGAQVVVMAGPCSVESREGLLEIAERVKQAGAGILRGGAFKPRTSPYSFQGMGEEGLKILAEARDLTGMPVVTEVMSPTQVELVSSYADLLQIGARNMQNYDLLKEVGQSPRPVLLKRGLAATIEELLMSAEYILASGGSGGVVLCERGIRTYESSTRNTLDLSSIPVIKQLSHLPVIVDPSHGTGNRTYVPSMALAAIAAGADGLMIEVHSNPPEAMSDGAQSLYPQQLRKLLRDISVIAPVVGRQLEGRHRSRQASSPATATATVSDPSRPPRVALQGEAGSFSEKAVHQHFGTDADTMSRPTFQEAFALVSEGPCEYAMIPVENSLTGSIHGNYDLMLEHEDLHIVGELKVRIEHNLLANAGVEIADIRRVYAHPQAAAQCDRFLRSHPEWQVVNMYDTAGSARFIKEQGMVDAAAIASSEAAEKLGLRILEQAIETDPRNFTRFLILSRRASEGEGDKVSIVFQTAHEPGALHRALEIIARHGVNMMKLESRPIHGKPWQYMFYVDMGVPEEPAQLETALKELEGTLPFLRTLGRYRSA
ncbi:MAG: 3-deoxy-7-phosphoheptulonate synthase [Armatimonadetes bacterium]|nr:3-deoxy-7-phosphoheptulonate synthase [Armatimonadota bacterium]